MDLRNLSQDAKIVPILAYASATTDRTSDVIDRRGFRNVLIVITNAAVHDSAAHTYKLQHADAATNETTLSSGADVEGTSQPVNTTDNTVQYIDGKPTKPYLQLVVAKDATQASAQSAVAILYNGSRPTVHGDGTSTVGEGVAAAAGELNGTGWVTGTA